MKSDEVTVRITVRASSLNFLAKVCRSKIMLCPVGIAFVCPFGFDKEKNEKECSKVTAKDWEAVMVEVDDADAD